MIVKTEVTIQGSSAAVWAVISDIENHAKVMNGIEKIEVLEKPASGGLVGLKWRETRLLFGKPASADKWIIAAADNEFYETRAESDGFVHTATMRISKCGDGVRLTTVHESKPQTLATRMMSIPMGLLFSGVAKKALLQDLSDVKAAVERG